MSTRSDDDDDDDSCKLIRATTSLPMTLNDLDRRYARDHITLSVRSPSIRSDRLTWSQQTRHGNSVGKGASLGVSHVPYPKGGTQLPSTKRVPPT